jgi:hypothetical protein
LLWPPNSDQLVWLFSSRQTIFAPSPVLLFSGHSIFSLTCASKVITSVFTLFVLGSSALHCWRAAYNWNRQIKYIQSLEYCFVSCETSVNITVHFKVLHHS